MASDLGLHCLSMSHEKAVRLKWVNDNILIYVLPKISRFEGFKQENNKNNDCANIDSLPTVGKVRIPNMNFAH